MEDPTDDVSCRWCGVLLLFCGDDGCIGPMGKPDTVGGVDRFGTCTGGTIDDDITDKSDSGGCMIKGVCSGPTPEEDIIIGAVIGG